jgi:CheY-like chemotaxis protein
MAGSIAHHFNNKLAAVMGNLELALDDLPQESGTRASIVESMKASRMAAEVSRMMLTYLGQTTGRKEPLDLVETIRETLLILGASISQHVHLKTDFQPRRPIILGDNLHIKQILTNLVSNAAEAIDQNEADITVAIQVTAAAEIQGLRFFPLEWEPKAEQYVCLSVTDIGCGMDVAAQEKVFDPFFSTKSTGRGLGLSVLLGLVGTHDGAVTVMSSPGRGAMFRVFFPLHTLEAVPLLQEEPLASRLVEEGGLALVVDDDPMVRNMVQIMLRRMAYEVIAAGDGYEAVEMFRARKDEINFVLLDLSMPGMDGWETLAQLRSLRPDIPVVLVSGYDEAQLMQGDHPHRPQAFMHKPYLKSDLAAAIDTALKKAVNTG